MTDYSIIDYTRDAIFRIGEVVTVEGRLVVVKVDQNKNLPHLAYKGELIKNVSVGGYVKLLKGYTALVGKVESENLKEVRPTQTDYVSQGEDMFRQLSIKLLGYFDNGRYYKGVKEMPLIGNVCQLLDVEEFRKIHTFGISNATINIGHLLSDDNIPIEIGISKLLTSHIGIFGNTGSGKSYTLASILHSLFEQASSSNAFKKNARFVVFDFNGEYSGVSSIISKKKSYKISTRHENGDRIPISENDILEPELLYIMANATEKTQQPFIKRALNLYENVQTKDNPMDYLKGILRHQVERVVKMSDGSKGKLMLDYLENILPPQKNNGIEVGLQSDLSWHGNQQCFYTGTGNNRKFFSDEKYWPDICNLDVYKAVDDYISPDDTIEKIIHYLYIQLIMDVLNNRAVNEHIAPVINRLKSFAKDFAKVFKVTTNALWDENNLAVIDLNKVNTSMKKLIPLLVCTKLYKEHKNLKEDTLSNTLHIVIDEAHNILSYESNRESEVWKDFRLETFEEIVKEGRKFGVFLILASQRPSDISPTIISQLHNYLIHRLVNNRDIEMVEKSISYLDKVSVESLPILPVGACVLSGVIADLPVIIQVEELPRDYQPQSENVDLDEHWGVLEFNK